MFHSTSRSNNTVIVWVTVFFQKSKSAVVQIIIRLLTLPNNWTLASNSSKILMTLNPLVLDHNRKQNCNLVIRKNKRV